MEEEVDPLLRAWLADLPASEDTSDAQLLRNLRADRTSGSTRDEDDAELLAYLREGVNDTTDTRSEEDLRSLGLNYKERDAILRSTAGRRNTSDRHHRTEVRRFRWHLTNRVGPSTPESELSELVGAWVALSQAHLDVAIRWWDAGIDPARPDCVEQLIAAGFTPRDLTRKIGRRTVLEELQRGASVQWCLMALNWRRPKN